MRNQNQNGYIPLTIVTDRVLTERYLGWTVALIKA